MDAARWARTRGELARLRLLNLVGEQGELGRLDCDDQRAAQASGLSGADLSAAWRYLHLQRLVVVEAGDGSGHGGTAMLSGEGALGHRARLRRLADPVATRWTLRSALLDWLLSGLDGDSRCLSEFHRDPRSVLEGIRPAGHNELQAAAVFLAGRGLVDLIDADGSRLSKVRITAAGRGLAAHIERTGRVLSDLDVRSNSEVLPGRSADEAATRPALSEAEERSVISMDEANELVQFLDKLRGLVGVDDMPTRRRIEMLALVDRLIDATRRADRAALRRSWARARQPLGAAGPHLGSELARLTLPAALSDPPAAAQTPPA